MNLLFEFVTENYMYMYIVRIVTIKMSPVSMHSIQYTCTYILNSVTIVAPVKE